MGRALVIKKTRAYTQERKAKIQVCTSSLSIFLARYCHGQGNQLLNKFLLSTQPLTYPSTFTIHHQLTEPSDGSSTIYLHCLVLSRSQHRPAARINEEVLIYDYHQGNNAAIKPYMAEVFNRKWEEQGKEMERWRRRMAEVEGMMLKLERESWAKEGATEDTEKRGLVRRIFK